MVYRAPVADMLFTMTQVGGLAQGLYPDFDADAARAILDEAAKMAEGTLAPLWRTGDLHPPVLEHGQVRTSPGWPQAYAQWRDGGWLGVTASEADGGLGLPHLLNAACLETWNGANMAFALAPLLCLGAIEALAEHGDEKLRARFLPHMVSGQWAATMNLTEPQAGSDLSLLRTRAERAAEGTYRISGEKIYITYGEHDLTDNIVHLVLARLPDAPPGTRGISLFLVPKFLVGDDGMLGARNGVRCTGLEHKMGIHASPTCTMLYEEATGYLIGEEHRGLACMFTMMNNARLAVGLQGVGLAERATQTALAFARERKQGRAPGDAAPLSAIINHPDIRRMILSMQAQTAAARAICYLTAHAIDMSHRATDDEARRTAQERAGLLTPIAKAYATDLANEAASFCVQVHGGMGYIEETGVAQLMRDARIAAIYEGTNGIQAIDLVARKIGLNEGAAFYAEVADMRKILADMPHAMERESLTAAVDALVAAMDFLRASDPATAFAGATPFLRLFALARGGACLAALAMADETGRTRSLCHFFAADLAPQAQALAASIMRSAESIIAGHADWSET